MNGNGQELEYEVIKLIAALQNYLETKKGLYYLNNASDHVLAIIADRPGMVQLMTDLGLAPKVSHSRIYKRSGTHDK